MYTYLCVCLYIYTGLFKMIVGVLTTCHTQHTTDSSMCIFFYLIEQHSKFLLHTVQVLYMCTICDSTNINTIIDNQFGTNSITIALIINQEMHHIKFHIKTLKIAPTCFDPKIILTELRCSLLKSF